MLTTRRVVPLLRAGLVVLFAVLLLLQVMSLPGQFRHMAEQDPGSAWLRWPLTVGAVLGVLCVQVVLVCTWRLLTLVQRDQIFTTASIRWVDTIVYAVAGAELLLLCLLVLVGATADDPGFLLLVLLVATGVAVLGLVVVVMRSLLKQATVLRSDLDEVI
ncbi:hypothetical protein ASG41_02925 [Modestobacter sp. Leaf380]|nr:hypothetical protein ASG41_02925 [Modestobacter sp. Leaf380]